jgi:hypothetical protein
MVNNCHFSGTFLDVVPMVKAYIGSAQGKVEKKVIVSLSTLLPTRSSSCHSIEWKQHFQEPKERLKRM